MGCSLSERWRLSQEIFARLVDVWMDGSMDGDC